MHAILGFDYESIRHNREMAYSGDHGEGGRVGNILKDLNDPTTFGQAKQNAEDYVSQALTTFNDLNLLNHRHTDQAAIEDIQKELATIAAQQTGSS